MEEEEAFWSLVRITQLNSIYETQGKLWDPATLGEEWNKAVSILSSLMQIACPEVHKKLDELHLPDLSYNQWFLTLFSRNLPLQILERVWDIFLVMGYEFIYFVALSVFKVFEDALLTCEEDSELHAFLQLENVTLLTQRKESIIKTAIEFSKQYHQVYLDIVKKLQEPPKSHPINSLFSSISHAHKNIFGI